MQNGGNVERTLEKLSEHNAPNPLQLHAHKPRNCRRKCLKNDDMKRNSTWEVGKPKGIQMGQMKEIRRRNRGKSSDQVELEKMDQVYGN